MIRDAPCLLDVESRERPALQLDDRGVAFARQHPCPDRPSGTGRCPSTRGTASSSGSSSRASGRVGVVLVRRRPTEVTNGSTQYPGATLWGTHDNVEWGIYRSGANHTGNAVAYLNHAAPGTGVLGSIRNGLRAAPRHSRPARRHGTSRHGCVTGPVA